MTAEQYLELAREQDAQQIFLELLADCTVAELLELLHDSLLAQIRETDRLLAAVLAKSECGSAGAAN